MNGDSVPVTLLPCPFCVGSDAEMPPVSTFDKHGRLVVCTACSALGPTRTTEAEAIAAWNTRLTSPAAGDVPSGWKLVPAGEPVSLNECPPGPFEFNGSLGFKTEYGAAKWLPERDAFTVSHWPDPYCLESGEAFWGGVSGQEARASLIVQPLAASPATDSAPTLASGDVAKLDWLQIAKAAGKYGIRYPTNTRLEAFLSEIAASPTTGSADQGDPCEARGGERPKCSICGGHSYAAVDVRQFDGTYAPGPERRCINCKTTFTAQAFAALTEGQQS